MGSERLQQWLLRLGLAISAVLLIRFALDFSEGMTWRLAAPFCLLVIVALGFGVANVLGASTSDIRLADEPSRGPKRAMLLTTIPLGFLASSLGCMGLSLQGCSPFCTFVKLVWIPLIALVCAVYFFTNSRILFTSVTLMAFVPLTPHCVCYNVGNAWWIDQIGASPVCYAWGFVVSVVAGSAMRRGGRLWGSLVTCIAIVTGAVGFFIAHHYFHFPW